jgi:hypothetical protein
MVDVIVRKSKREIVLALAEEKELERIYSHLAHALAESFRSLPTQKTDAEVRRRFDLAFETWVELRAEYEFTLDRLAAALPTTLMLRLLGLPWEPQEVKRKRGASGRRKSWSPSGYHNVGQIFAPQSDLIDPRHVTHELQLAGFPTRAKLSTRRTHC